MKARSIVDGTCEAQLLERPQPPIDLFYIFACGIFWQKEANQDAGRELVQELASPNPMVLRVAKGMLNE